MIIGNAKTWLNRFSVQNTKDNFLMCCNTMRSRGFCGFIRCVGDVKLLSEVVVVLPGGVQVPVGDDGATPKVSESERGRGRDPN